MQCHASALQCAKNGRKRSQNATARVFANAGNDVLECPKASFAVHGAPMADEARTHAAQAVRWRSDLTAQKRTLQRRLFEHP
jgi:hypothetical protein